MSNHQVHQLALSLPHSPDTTISLHLTNTSHVLLVVLASSTTGAPSTSAALGSLVYALPNPNNATQPLSTALYTRNSTIEFATRLAKILARKLHKPVYVGGELKLWEMEDEAAAVRAITDVVSKTVQAGLVNGHNNPSTS